MRNEQSRYCIVVPCFENHAAKLENTLNQIKQHIPNLIVVDDGSSTKNAEKIKAITKKNGGVLVINKQNGGKGSAIKLGLRKAYQLNFTHAIQIDSDGQHDISAIDKIINVSKKYPDHLISGRPVYDESIPLGRKLGRYLTHVWVWIETLSLEIVDSMCGFRAYPLKNTLDILKSPNIGNRMDFDPEVMVKYYWGYRKVKFFPIKVVYPDDGLSYFNVLNDNWLITKMHTKLFFGMLIRSPNLLFGKLTNKNWRNQSEKGVVSFIKIGLWLHQNLGKNFSKIVISITSFYYYLFAFASRKSSKKYQNIYQEYCKKNNYTYKSFNSYDHIKSFANMFLDRLSVWKDLINLEDINSDDIRNFKNLQKNIKGAFFIGSHYGNLEILRALGRSNYKVNFKALIYTKNSHKLLSILKEFAPDAEDNIIPIQNFSPEVACKLIDYAEKGEWIFCNGDRITENSNKAINSTLLGKKIRLPMGPFFLAYLLDVPVYSLHCYHDGKDYRIQFKEISKDLTKKTYPREDYIQKLAQGYTHCLQDLILNEPKQWFNFYDYWEIHE